MREYKMTDRNDCRFYTDALVTINMYDGESFSIEEDRGWLNVWIASTEAGWKITYEAERTLKYSDSWVKCSDMQIMEDVHFAYIDEAVENVQDRVYEILDGMGCFNG